MTKDTKENIITIVFLISLIAFGWASHWAYVFYKPPVDSLSQTEEELCKQYAKSGGFEMYVPDCISRKGEVEARQVMVQIKEVKYVGCFSDEGCRWKKETITLQQAFDMLNLKYTPPSITETTTEAKLEWDIDYKNNMPDKMRLQV